MRLGLAVLILSIQFQRRLEQPIEGLLPAKIALVYFVWQRIEIIELGNRIWPLTDFMIPTCFRAPPDMFLSVDTVTPGSWTPFCWVDTLLTLLWIFSSARSILSSFRVRSISGSRGVGTACVSIFLTATISSLTSFFLVIGSIAWSSRVSVQLSMSFVFRHNRSAVNYLFIYFSLIN